MSVSFLTWATSSATGFPRAAPVEASTAPEAASAPTSSLRFFSMAVLPFPASVRPPPPSKSGVIEETAADRRLLVHRTIRAHQQRHDVRYLLDGQNLVGAEARHVGAWKGR